MQKVNYHTHTTGSDGTIEPEDWIKLAIKKKFNLLGITDHYHYPPQLKKENFYTNEHYQKLKKLKRKYKDKIKILINVEFDFFKNYKKWIKKEATKRKYDLRFISIHFLKIKKKYLPIDYSEKIFQEMINESKGIKKLIKTYYSSLRQAIKMNCFDVVSHLDLIKMWNKDKKYFSEKESWYKKEIKKTLKLIKKKNMKLDLNSKGFRKPCKEQYPSKEILKEA